MFNVRAVSKGLTRMRVFTPSKSYFLYPLVLVFCNPQYQYIIVSRFWMKISVDPSLNFFKCQSKFYQKSTYLFFMKNSFRVFPSCLSLVSGKLLRPAFSKFHCPHRQEDAINSHLRRRQYIIN